MLFKSLKFRIIVALSVIVAISLAALSFYFDHRVKQELTNVYQENALNLLEATNAIIETGYNSIAYHKKTMLERRKLELKNSVAIVHNLIVAVHQDYMDGNLSQLQAKRKVLRKIKQLRFENGVGYFWINDTTLPYPTMVMHPTMPSLDGTVLDSPNFNNALGVGANLFKSVVDLCNKQGDGYVDYLWPKVGKNGLSKKQPKISYVKLFKPWNWIIGTGLYIDDIEKYAQQRLNAVVVELNDINKKFNLGKDGYFYIFNDQDRFLVHPYLAGNNIAAAANIINHQTGNRLVDDLRHAVHSGQISLDYLWDRPEHKGEFRFIKRAYITYYEPLSWYICCSFHVDNLAIRIESIGQQIFVFAVLFFVLAFIVAILIANNITSPLNALVRAIKNTDDDGIPLATIPLVGTTEIRALIATLNDTVTSISLSRQNLQESQTRYHALYENAGDAIILFRDMKAVDCNQQTEQMFDCDREDLIARSPVEFSPLVQPDGSSSIERSHELFAMVLSGKPISFEWLHKTKNNVEFYAEVKLSLVALSIGSHIMAIIRNINDRKEQEQVIRLRTDELAESNAELVQYKTNLEQLVQERTFELNTSLNQLTEAQHDLVEAEKMASLGALVAGVAHEINTPIGISVTAASHLADKTARFAAIYQSGQLARSDFEDYIAVATESSQMILTNVDRAANLIQSFKQVAVDQSSDVRRIFEIKSYIDEIIASLYPRFKKNNHKIIVNCDEDFTINSYPGALAQIFTNLLINSLDHGFEEIDNGTITITISKHAKSAQIIYQDTGCGIRDKHLNKIFEPFFTTKRGRGGSGLGMHIVYNQITQTLGGTIKCSSTVGEGTRFDLEFPCDLTV